MIWTVVLLGVGAFLAGGAISLRRQNAHISWIFTCWALAVGCVVAGWVLTL